jgi:thioredoxin 1
MKELQEQEFEAHLRQARTPVLVDFYAPWCGPCRMLAPVLETVATELAGRVEIVKVNVDEAPGLAERYGVRAVPTLIVFQQGRPVDTLVGMVSHRQLKSRLEVAAASAAPTLVAS